VDESKGCLRGGDSFKSAWSEEVGDGALSRRKGSGRIHRMDQQGRTTIWSEISFGPYGDCDEVASLLSRWISVQHFQLKSDHFEY